MAVAAAPSKRSTATRVYLERPSLRRERQYLDACHRSRALHRGFVTSAINPEEYREYLRRTRRPAQESFFVVAAATAELAGVVNINDIASERESSALLGYYAFVPYAATGLMREGVVRVIDFAFRELGLLAIEAKIQPVNHRSLRLAHGLGFRPDEGRRDYVKIGARWLDHELWVLSADDWSGLSRRRYACA